MCMAGPVDYDDSRSIGGARQVLERVRTGSDLIEEKRRSGGD